MLCHDGVELLESGRPDVQAQLDALTLSMNSRMNKLEADFHRSSVQAVAVAHDQIKETLSTLQPASFHQATIYFCLKSASTSRSTKTCFAVGSLVLLVLQIVVIITIINGAVFTSCVESDGCIRGTFCEAQLCRPCLMQLPVSASRAGRPSDIFGSW